MTKHNRRDTQRQTTTPTPANDTTNVRDLTKVRAARRQTELLARYQAAPQIGRSPEAALWMLLAYTLSPKKLDQMHALAVALRHHDENFMGALQFLDKVSTARRTKLAAVWPQS